MALDSRAGPARLGDPPLVEGIPGVAADPRPFDVPTARQFVQALHQVDIQHRTLRTAPPLRLLSHHPFGGGVDHVLAVAAHLDPRAPGELLERLDGRGQLHAVVRGSWLAPKQLPVPVRSYDDDAPAARAGIGGASAVGVDDRSHVGGIIER